MSTNPAERSLALLQSIDQGIRTLVTLMGRNPATAGGTIASDKDLDSKYGDEEVRFNPKDWAGAPIKGKHMSQCPPEALDLLADAFDYFAGKAAENQEKTPQGKPVAEFKRKSAARARGWALRLRNGWKPSATRAYATGPNGDGWPDDDQRGW